MTSKRADGPRANESRAILEESIQDGMRYILGESGLQMILSQHPIETLSSDAAAFHAFLVSIFMENGAAILEREIARRMLDKARKEYRLPRLSWRASITVGGDRSRRVTLEEMRSLRQFVALASLPRDHRSRPTPDLAGSEGMTTSIEYTSLAFADAFKKGI